MSYLTTPELNEFSQAVISFWFRVPQASLDAAQQQEDDWWAAWTPDGNQDQPPFLGLVPLIVFGKPGTSRTSNKPEDSFQEIANSTSFHECVMQGAYGLDGNPAIPGSVAWLTEWAVCYDHVYDHPYTHVDISYSPVPGKPIEPSYIAINGNGTISVHFESTQLGDTVLAYGLASSTTAYYVQAKVDVCWTNVGYCGDYHEETVSIGGVWGILQIVFTLIGYEFAAACINCGPIDNSDPRVYHKSVSTYGPVPGDWGTASLHFAVPKSFDADTWHHVLVSVDMGDASANGLAVGEDISNALSHIKTSSKMYVAVDDVNYPTGAVNTPFEGTNQVYPTGAITTAYSYQAADIERQDDGTVTRTPEGPVPSYSIGDMSVPAAEVGIPATGKYEDDICKVEMAELFFFTDHVLDTSMVANRRLFITAPGKKTGKQYPTNPTPITLPFYKYAVGDPPIWETGADIPAFVPYYASQDPSAIPTGVKLDGEPTIAKIDFTKCCVNWQMGRNLGTLKGKVVRTGKIKAYSPDPSIVPGG